MNNIVERQILIQGHFTIKSNRLQLIPFLKNEFALRWPTSCTIIFNYFIFGQATDATN